MDDAVGLTARFAAKPLEQPKYSIRDVPKCSKDLSGSILQEITDRDIFSKSMAEMVLLCNEVTRRRDSMVPVRKLKKVKRSAKPLSLEYMADRLDVDDPLFGFIVRTNMPNPNLSQEQQLKFQEGMMQGFITITTFTNYQASFRWDSMHDSAFSYDEPEIADQMASRQRKADYDGSLSAELQNTVRCGDVWNEGVVFPHIAEISLLGALGCGRTLVSLAIERLEGMNSTGCRNYDYVALQATKNSVQFYESMGFVRVGAITDDENFEKKQKAKEKGNSSDTDTNESKTESINQKNNDSNESVFVSKPTTTVTTTKMGQTPMDLAKKYQVNVWDIIFLNRLTYPTIEPRSWLKKGIQLYCPDPTEFDGISNASHNKKASIKSSATQWYYAANNETPKQISEENKVTCRSLIEANRERFGDLAPNSRLMPRTRIQVSNLSTHHDKHIPYCHWTFPDDDFESSEPSYMMARKLNRRKGRMTKLKPFESSLCAPIEIYVPKTDDSSQPTVRTPLMNSRVNQPCPQMENKAAKLREKHPDEPIPPKRPKSAFVFYIDEEKQKLKAKNKKVTPLLFTMDASNKWKEFSTRKKSKYEDLNIEATLKYQDALKEYGQELEKFKSLHPNAVDVDIKKDVSNPRNYFDKVVTLNSDGQKEAGGEFKYYYVLTFIPDLFWCHLAPLQSCGFFDQSRPQSQGRPKWVLVDENQGKEVDISASVCKIVESVATTKCPDADDEQWDIFQSGNCLADPVSDAHHQVTMSDIDYGHTISVDTNKHKQPKRKRNVGPGDSPIEESAHPSRIEKNGREQRSVEATKKKTEKKTGKGERQLKRGRARKNLSQESAVASSTDYPKTDGTEDAGMKQRTSKRVRQSGELDSEAIMHQECINEPVLNSANRTLVPASELLAVYEKASDPTHIVDKTTEEETRSKFEGSKNDPVLDSTQLPAIYGSVKVDSRGLVESEKMAESMGMNEGSAMPPIADYTDKVVTLNSDGQKKVGGECKYYYVVKFIPYLFRCSLAPMRRCGVFGSNRPQSQGRPTWLLVDENEATEIDISASVCKIVDSIATLQCSDADNEQWDIPESGHHMVSGSRSGHVHNEGTKVDIKHGHAALAFGSVKKHSKLKLRRKYVGLEETSTEKPPYLGVIRPESGSKATVDQGYVKNSALNSFTRLWGTCEKASNSTPTVDKTIEEESRKTFEGSKNDPVLDSMQPPTIDDSINVDSRRLVENKRKMESMSKNEGNISPVTLPSSHGGAKEDVVSKSTLLSVDDKVRHSDSICARLDSFESSRDVKEGSRKNSLTSLNLPLDLDEKDTHQPTRKGTHVQEIGKPACLSDRTLCISEDSNQTFSDVSCEITVKERETKQPLRNRKMMGTRKRSTPLILDSSPEVKQKTITSFFQCIKQNRS